MPNFFRLLTILGGPGVAVVEIDESLFHHKNKVHVGRYKKLEYLLRAVSLNL